MNVTLDVYEGAQLDVGDTGRYVRPAIIENITADDLTGDITDFLFKVREAVIAEALANPLSQPAYILRRVVLVAVSDQSASAQVIYETFTGGGPPSTYLLSDDTTLTTYQTYTMPDTYEEITVDWAKALLPGSVQSDAKEFNVYVPKDNITFNFLRPLRTIRVSALIYGSPYEGQGWPGTAPPAASALAGRDKVGHVNSESSWPSIPGSGAKGTAFWLLTRFSTAFAKYQGYYQLDAETVTRIHSDWSEYGTLRDQKTGHYVPIDPAEKATALAAAYSRGIHPYNGFVKVCPYYPTSFHSIFGF
jgi:hypothetical protein